MQCNVAPWDRILRTLLGVTFATLALLRVGGMAWDIVFAVLAILGLATGLSGWCGIYRLLHFSTLRKEA